MAFGYQLDHGFMCSICKKVIARKNDFKRHVREMHTEDRNWAYHCPKCPSVRRRLKRNLVDHISKYHPELRGLDVEACADFEC